MQFHLEFTPKQFDLKLNYLHPLFLIGSCFTEQIGNKLANAKFNIIENPNGILFNPISISNAILSYIKNKQYKASDLFYQNECWNSWQHHSRFSNPDKIECLKKINLSQNAAYQFLKKAEWVLITLGSAFVYELSNKEVASNCHKVPTDKFNKKLLTVNEIKKHLTQTIKQLTTFNNKIKIIFTISPVRHVRDGLVENNKSKAALIQAVHSLTNQIVFYFPAYELVIDDLRDYRFFAEDMVHPNYAATNYVWEKFIATCIDEPSQKLIKTMNEINAAVNHKPFNPNSEAHKNFKKKYLELCKTLQQNHPLIYLQKEINFFSIQ